MPGSARRTIRTLPLVGVLCLGWFASQSTPFFTIKAWAASPSAKQSAKVQGDAERGREIFNGKGVCYYCHGVDGYRDKVPQLEADTAALIAQLNPQPADLRNLKSLRLTSDRARAKAIREGHPGTGMFPDTTMTNQELTDTLAYLALLRSKGSAKRK